MADLVEKQTEQSELLQPKDDDQNSNEQTELPQSSTETIVPNDHVAVPPSTSHDDLQNGVTNTTENIDENSEQGKGKTSPVSQKSVTPELSTKDKIVKELEKMKKADQLKEEWKAYEFKKLHRKHKDELERQGLAKGIQLNEGVNEAKSSIKAKTDEEEFFALKNERRKFREESAIIRRQLEEKMGLLIRRENPDLKKMVETFIYTPEDNSTIPDRILKVLSWSEIEDLKKSFDLFDVKSKGYINSRDVKRIAKMLGFVATKEVFDGMIGELAGQKRDRVTFINFLDFIIKSQGEGPDPYDEIQQAFRLMDTEENGYLTLTDLKQICEQNNLKFSNKVLLEMIEEADNTGDGKITLQEFTNIMCQTGRFKLCAPP